MLLLPADENNSNVQGTCAAWADSNIDKVCPGTGSIGLVHCLAHDARLRTACRPALLSTFVQRVLLARERAMPEDLQAYAPLLRILSADELREPVLSNVGKMIKRSPENTLATLAVLLQSSSVEWDTHALQLMKELLPLIRHIKEPIRYASLCSSNILMVIMKKMSKCLSNERGR